MNLDVKELLLDTLQKYHISQARACREIGRSPAVISQYLTSGYAGDEKKFLLSKQQQLKQS